LGHHGNRFREHSSELLPDSFGGLLIDLDESQINELQLGIRASSVAEVVEEIPIAHQEGAIVKEVGSEVEFADDSDLAARELAGGAGVGVPIVFPFASRVHEDGMGHGQGCDLLADGVVEEDTVGGLEGDDPDRTLESSGVAPGGEGRLEIDRMDLA